MTRVQRGLLEKYIFSDPLNKVIDGVKVILREAVILE
jgi:hypothetical protein